MSAFFYPFCGRRVEEGGVMKWDGRRKCGSGIRRDVPSATASAHCPDDSEEKGNAILGK